MRQMCLKAVIIALTTAIGGQAVRSADDASAVLERVQASVVLIQALDRNKQPVSIGSGFAVAQGIVATNVHVLEGGARFVVTRHDGKSVVATGIWGFDVKHDLALLQLGEADGNGNLPLLKLAPPESVKVGVPIYAVGHPRGLEFTVSRGIISSADRKLRLQPGEPVVKVIQSDAAVSGGSSGGPWINEQGEVVGVCRSKLVGEDAQNLNFAAHVEQLAALLKRPRKRMLKVDHFAGGAELTRAWRTLVPPENAKRPLFSALKSLNLQGPTGRNELGNVQLDGTWAFEDGVLQPKGVTTAVSLAVAEDFTLEGVVDFGREGGCFILLGWNDDSGYCIRDPGLRTLTGWSISEIKDGKLVPGTDHIFTQATVKGVHPINISVVQNYLTVTFGPTEIAKNYELPNYREGNVVFGTYRAGYGPRPLKIRSARIRAD